MKLICSRCFIRLGDPTAFGVHLTVPKGFQGPSDLRVQKTPEYIFHLMVFWINVQRIQPFFDGLVDEKRIAAGINDETGRIGSQIEQIPA